MPCNIINTKLETEWSEETQKFQSDEGYLYENEEIYKHHCQNITFAENQDHFYNIPLYIGYLCGLYLVMLVWNKLIDLIFQSRYVCPMTFC